MGERDEEERRQHPRYGQGSRFHVHAPGGPPQLSRAENQGPGGAFIPVQRPVPVGSHLVIEAHEPMVKGPPVLLVAEVMYCREIPTPGIGIQWRYAVCLDGIDHLAAFLEVHFHLFLDPKRLGSYERGLLEAAIRYEFLVGSVNPIAAEVAAQWRTGRPAHGIRFPQDFLPKLARYDTWLAGPGQAAPPVTLAPGHQAPDATGPLIEPVPPRDEPEAPTRESAEKTSAHRHPGPITRPLPPPGAEPGQGEAAESDDGPTTEFCDEDEAPDWKKVPLEDWARDVRHRTPIQLPVALLFMNGDEAVSGVARNLDAKHVFVLSGQVRVFRGERVVVRFPVSLGPLSVQVILVGRIVRIARDRGQGRMGLDLEILHRDEDDQPGILLEYLDALRARRR